MKKRIKYFICQHNLSWVVLILLICTTTVSGQSIREADQTYREFIQMRSVDSISKEDIYNKALECTRAYKQVLISSPKGVENYEKSATILASLYPFLKAGAGFSSQARKDSVAVVFAREAVNLAMMTEMADKNLRKDNYYPELVYFVAARTYNKEDYENAVIYLKEYMDVTDTSKHTRVLAYLKEAEGLVAQKKKREEKFEDVYKGIPYFDVFACVATQKLTPIIIII